MNSNSEAIAYAVVDVGAHADLTGIDQKSLGNRGGYFTLTRSLTPGSTDAFPIVRLQGKIAGTTSYFEFFRFVNASTSQAEETTVLIHPDASTFGTAGSTTNEFTAATMRAMPLPAVWRVFSTNTSTGQPIWGLSANLVQ